MIDVSRFVETLNGKPVAVYGLGLSNLAAIRALKAAGATIIAGDDKPDNLARARDLGAETPDNFVDQDFSRFGCLVLAPGVPLTFKPHPVVSRALAAKLEILCDIEILHRCNPGVKTIGITGTNGKSTTTALIGHILTGCGIPCAVGGNIGTPVLDLNFPSVPFLPPPAGGRGNTAGRDVRGIGTGGNAPPSQPFLPQAGGRAIVDDKAVIVLELSSFQLDLCPTFAPDIAVHLNLTPDHLDRHGTMEAYVDAKLRMFRGKGQAIIGVDDEPSRTLLGVVLDQGGRAVWSLSVLSDVEEGVFARDGVLFDAMKGEAEQVFPLDAPNLKGQHNWQNIGAAYAVARLLGCDPVAIHDAVITFPGLNHRQFRVRTMGSVVYINDSKATNADATAWALAAHDDIYWIVGGKPKEGGLIGLEGYAGRIRHAFLIGEAASDFAAFMTDNKIPYTVSHILETAVAQAHEAAQKAGRGTVLLSPACASYDQFKNFEERGDLFTKLVKIL